MTRRGVPGGAAARAPPPPGARAPERAAAASPAAIDRRAMMSTRASLRASVIAPKRGTATKNVPSSGSRARARPLARRVVAKGANDAGESEVFRAWDQATKSQRRTDLKKIMILGAGPIVIGQVRAMVPRSSSRTRANGRAAIERFETASSGLNISNRERGDAIASR